MTSTSRPAPATATGLGGVEGAAVATSEEQPMAINHPNEIQKYQALAVFHGIKFLLMTGHPITPAYTEVNMARTASMFTGMEYKKGQLKDAAADLRLWFSDICNHTVDDEPIEYPDD
jgi:hypothetical protein